MLKIRKNKKEIYNILYSDLGYLLCRKSDVEHYVTQLEFKIPKEMTLDIASYYYEELTENNDEIQEENSE